MNQFTITTELINKVLEYLGTRPAAESMQLIIDIQGEYQAQVSKPVDPDTIGGGLGVVSVEELEYTKDQPRKPSKKQKNIA